MSIRGFAFFHRAKPVSETKRSGVERSTAHVIFMRTAIRQKLTLERNIHEIEAIHCKNWEAIIPQIRPC